MISSTTISTANATPKYLYLFIDRPRSEIDGTATVHLRSQDKIMDKLGIDTKQISAWYIGRWVWAKHQHKYKFSGMCDEGSMQKSLMKFLRAHKIDKDDLTVRLPDGSQRKVKIKNLKSPADFAAMTTKHSAPNPGADQIRLWRGRGSRVPHEQELSARRRHAQPEGCTPSQEVTSSISEKQVESRYT